MEGKRREKDLDGDGAGEVMREAKKVQEEEEEGGKETRDTRGGEEGRKRDR